MQTDFFGKRLYLAVVGVTLVLFTLSTILYAAFLWQAQSVWLGQSFYFLLSPTEHIEAGAYDAQWKGGAGYLLEYDGKEYVALSVYLHEEEGIAVQNSMTENTSLLQIDVGWLYFKTCMEKRKVTLYQSALNCLHGCMEVLDGEINRLAKGATQQSALRSLGILWRQLNYLSAVYADFFPKYAQTCKCASEQLNNILSDIVYVKDLRYLLCDVTANYLQICKNFSL